MVLVKITTKVLTPHKPCVTTGILFAAIYRIANILLIRLSDLVTHTVECQSENIIRTVYTSIFILLGFQGDSSI